MRPPYRSGRHARGQALTELAVCAAVLVPLFLLVPVVAKFSHANQMAQQAARNAAWAATVSQGHALPQRAQLQRVALEQAFADADAPIRTNANPPANGEFADPMLNTFSGRKLLERDNLRVQNLRQGESPGFLDDAVGLVPQGLFPLNRRGYVTSEVRLEYRNLQNRDGSRPSYLDPFDRLDVVQTRRHSLLVDPWNASGPRSGARSVVATVRPLAPISRLDGIDTAFDSLKVLEPILPIVGALGDLDFDLQPDVVPADKLQDYPVRSR